MSASRLPNLLLLGVVMLALASCGKKPSASPQAAAGTQAAALPQSEDAAPATSADQQSTVSAAPAAAQGAITFAPQPTTTPPVPAEVPSGDASTVLANLTQLVRRYGAERQRVPASLNEVIAAGYVAGMPQAPPGKKFALDAKKMEVILVNQ